MDICKLALEHLQVPSDCFTDLVETFRLLLDTSPNDFWDAFGAISQQTVLEQIFNSPNLERLLMQAHSDDTSEIETALDWIEPCVASIKAGSLPAVCRSIMHQLWTRFQREELPSTSRQVCRRKGLQALTLVLQTMKQQSRQAGGAAIADVLEVVRSCILPLLEDLAASRRSGSELVQQRLHGAVVQHALALDCALLSSDRDVILSLIHI